MNTHEMISQTILKEMHWIVFTAAQFKEAMALGFFRQLLHGSIIFQDPMSHLF